MRIYEYLNHELKFSFEARTSRGKIDSHVAHLIKVSDSKVPGLVGFGEASPLKGLSIDALDNFPSILQSFLSRLNQGEQIPPEELEAYPAINFALETAHLDLENGGRRVIFESTFLQQEPIWINGLVWMSQIPLMLAEATKKVESGFSCIKFKVGAHDFDAECGMLEQFRKKHLASKVQIRLDANGAFETGDAAIKLKELNRFDIHSIEQPIATQQPDALEKLCKTSPIAIALDEELIGKIPNVESEKWLRQISPCYLILKPTLIGGIKNANHWIKIAENLNINWWATSALESNIGLNAIAQWVATKHPIIPQGLGTGMLYENNFPSPLLVKGEHLFYLATHLWKLPNASS
jgi:o-succinylbenzoate synthase